jgi:hypothetical protein
MKSFLAVMFLLGSFAVAHAQKTSVVPGICDPTSHVDVNKNFSSVMPVLALTCSMLACFCAKKPI